MDTLQLTAYLTPQTIPAVDLRPESTAGDYYLVPLTWTSGDVRPLRINAFLNPNGHHPLLCKFPAHLVPGHTWQASSGKYYATEASVLIDLPRSPFWARAGFACDLTGTPVSIGPTPPEGPAGSSADESLLIPIDGWSISGLHPVPGELLQVTHETYLAAGSYAVSAWHTCKGLSGGYVKAKQPHVIEGAYAYDVEVQGVLFTDVEPTDFTEYFVDEWVFVLRHNSDAVDLSFAAETGTAPAAGETLRIAPLSILGV